MVDRSVFDGVPDILETKNFDNGTNYHEIIHHQMVHQTIETFAHLLSFCVKASYLMHHFSGHFCQD